MSEESSGLPFLLAGVGACAVAYMLLAETSKATATSAAPSVHSVAVPVVTTKLVVPPTPAVSATALSSAPANARRRFCAEGDECDSAPPLTTAPTQYAAYSSAPTALVRYTTPPTAPTAEYANEPTARVEHSSAPTAEYTSAPTARVEYSSAPTAEYTSAPTALPTSAPTELPSWPYHVGASGASCEQACEQRSLVCDEEAQDSTTYGRAVAFEALRRAGVAQKLNLEDEWQGNLRVRDGYDTTDGGQSRSMPGLWMDGSKGTPNWKSDANRSVRSTCSASYAGLRRVCACKVASAGPASYEPTIRVAPAPTSAARAELTPTPRAVVSSGLVVHVAAASYSGSGNAIVNLVSGAAPATLHGKWEVTTIDSKRGIRFINNDAPSKNGSCLALPSITLRTIAMGIYIHDSQDDMRFLLDGRSNGPFVTNKTGVVTEEIERGVTYINGSARPLSEVVAMLQTRSWSWQHLAFVMSVPTSETSVKVFARSSMQEGLDASLGSVQLYDRALSAGEVRQCFDASF